MRTAFIVMSAASLVAGFLSRELTLGIAFADTDSLKHIGSTAAYAAHGCLFEGIVYGLRGRESTSVQNTCFHSWFVIDFAPDLSICPKDTASVNEFGLT